MAHAKEATMERERIEGADRLRRSPMMVRLLDALESGKDVGHYGRLVFAIIARHFMDIDDIVTLLARQPDQDESRARAMVMQVVDRGYSPPRREKILEWQAKQDYMIIEHSDDPDDGNLYRDLEFPDGVYDHIAEYHEEQIEAHDAH